MTHSDFDPGHQNASTESRIVASLERISQAFRVLLWQESKEHSLTPIQVQVLLFIRFHSADKCKVSHLAEEFNMTKATISETVKTLGLKRLITKEAELHDTRSYIIRLTAKGEALADRTSLFSKAILQPIESLHTDDKENLLLSLLGIIRHLNRTGIITVQRMCLTCCHYRHSEGGHFCKLLNAPLKPADLRIDCPEHLTAQD